MEEKLTKIIKSAKEISNDSDPKKYADIIERTALQLMDDAHTSQPVFRISQASLFASAEDRKSVV